MCYLYLFYYISFIVASHACTEMHRKEFMYCNPPPQKKKHLHSLWATFAFLLLLKKQNKQKHHSAHSYQ